jgi:membrane-associated phospholipid phosphatase
MSRGANIEPAAAAMTAREQSRVAALLRRLSGPHKGRRWYRDLRLVVGVAVAALAIWAFSTLFEDVWEREALVRWDAAAADWAHLHSTPGGDRFFRGLTQLGSSTFILLMAAAIAPALWRQRVLFVGWIAAFAGGVGLEYLFKAIMQRPRPAFAAAVIHKTSYSFPSGHAMASIVGYVMLAYLVVRLAGLHGWQRVLVYAAAGMLIAAIGLSRIYLGAHYPSDVLAGYAAGGAWVAVCLTGIRAAERRGGDLQTVRTTGRRL